MPRVPPAAQAITPVDVGPLPLLIALLFTCIICFVEVPREAKASLRSCLVVPFLLFLLLRIIGNSLTTFLATPILSKYISTTYYWNGFLDAFAGVFAFEAVLSKTNITLFGKGVLTIEDWIAQAKQNAIARVLKNDTQRTDRRQQQVAVGLRDRYSEEELNTYLATYLGVGTVAELERKAAESHANTKLYKALALAQIDKAEQLLRR